MTARVRSRIVSEAAILLAAGALTAVALWWLLVVIFAVGHG